MVDPRAYSQVAFTGLYSYQIDNAMALVEGISPPWTSLQGEQFLGRMMDDALSVGLVGVHDAMVSEDDYRFYERWVLYRPNSL